ncbi:unnamed protein product [Symbiodinium sp. CCMP2592]|nr:unnamed protein product [Symbiodinium sp. CCMP2592]
MACAGREGEGEEKINEDVLVYVAPKTAKQALQQVAAAEGATYHFSLAERNCGNCTEHTGTLLYFKRCRAAFTGRPQSTKKAAENAAAVAFLATPTARQAFEMSQERKSGMKMGFVDNVRAAEGRPTLTAQRGKDGPMEKRRPAIQ